MDHAARMLAADKRGRALLQRVVKHAILSDASGIASCEPTQIHARPRFRTLLCRLFKSTEPGLLL